MPRLGDRYDLREILRWQERKRKEREARDAEPTGNDRLANTRADREAFKLERERGNFLPVAEHQALLKSFCVVTRDGLLNLIPSLAAAVANRDLRSAQVVIKERIHAFLRSYRVEDEAEEKSTEESVQASG